MSQRPDFMIIGAAKRGTSLLHAQLSAQEGIVMSMPEEPNFFSDEDVWGRGLSWYSSLFARARATDLCGESSTHYADRPRYPEVVSRIREHAPDARFIYVMCNPIERLLSHYVEAWAAGLVGASLDKALDAQPALVQRGQYAMQLAPYFAAFGKHRVLPVFLERLDTAPDDELRRICAFVGYRGQPKWKRDMDVGVDNPIRKSRLRDTLVHSPGIAQLRRRVPRGVRERFNRIWRMRRRPDVSEGQRRRLEAVFNPSLAELGAHLGLAELNCANFDEATRTPGLGWTENTEG